MKWGWWQWRLQIWWVRRFCSGRSRENGLGGRRRWRCSSMDETGREYGLTTRWWRRRFIMADGIREKEMGGGGRGGLGWRSRINRGGGSGPQPTGTEPNFSARLWVNNLRRKHKSGFFLGWHHKGALLSSPARWAPLLGLIFEAMNPE
jgi:hypothetical protein